MPYTVELWLPPETGQRQRLQAQQRFADALQAHLGDAALVWPTYQAFAGIVQRHGESPDVEQLSPAEREIYEYWRIAEAAALAAAFGDHRYMGEGQYEIKPA